MTIVNISDNVIAIQPALQYMHYGAADITLREKGQEVDTRAVVGHLSRNIKIINGGS